MAYARDNEAQTQNQVIAGSQITGQAAQVYAATDNTTFNEAMQGLDLVLNNPATPQRFWRPA